MLPVFSARALTVTEHESSFCIVKLIQLIDRSFDTKLFEAKVSPAHLIDSFGKSYLSEKVLEKRTGVDGWIQNILNNHVTLAVNQSYLNKVQKTHEVSDISKLLEPGRLYTFALLPEGRVRIGLADSVYRDKAAKHGVLAAEYKIVFYAGELRLREDGVLELSNASGTFQPQSESLQKLEDFFRKVLGVEKIQTMAVGD